MSEILIQPHPAPAILARGLQPFGITIGHRLTVPMSPVERGEITWTHVGDLRFFPADGRVVVKPCADAGSEELVALLRTAEDTVMTGLHPKRASGTGRTAGKRWLSIPIDVADIDDIATAEAANANVAEVLA